MPFASSDCPSFGAAFTEDPRHRDVVQSLDHCAYECEPACPCLLARSHPFHEDYTVFADDCLTEFYSEYDEQESVASSRFGGAVTVNIVLVDDYEDIEAEAVLEALLHVPPPKDGSAAVVHIPVKLLKEVIQTIKSYFAQENRRRSRELLEQTCRRGHAVVVRSASVP